MQTPIKNTSIKFIEANFEQTHHKQTPSTLMKQQNQYDLDLLETQKKTTLFHMYPDRILRVQEFQHLRNNRAKLMDWYLQVFSSYRLSWECYWFAVELLDMLFADFNYVTLNNVHKVGVVSCFIAAKIIGKPVLSLQTVQKGIGHSKFSKSQILDEQGKILNLIFNDSNLQRITVYSYLMQKYYTVPQGFLSKAMQMLVLAFMRPQTSFEELGVRTYRQLIDRVMIEISSQRSIPVLEMILEDIKMNFGMESMSSFGRQMRF